MLHAHDCTIQTNTYRGRCLVQLGIINARGYYIACRITGDRIRHQFPHQHAGNAGVPIWKMKEIFLRFFIGNSVIVHAFAGRGIKVHADKTRQIDSPCILRCNGVNAQSEIGRRDCLKQPDQFLADADHIS